MRDNPNAARHGENLGFHNHKYKKALRHSHRRQRADKVEPKICGQDFVAKILRGEGRRRSRVAIVGRGLTFFRARKIFAPRWFCRAGRGSFSGKIGARLVLERIFVLGKS
jgi:hypothetical protein